MASELKGAWWAFARATIAFLMGPLLLLLLKGACG